MAVDATSLFHAFSTRSSAMFRDLLLWITVVLASVQLLPTAGALAQPVSPPTEQTKKGQSDFGKALDAFLKEASREHFVALRKHVISHEKYSPYSTELKDIAKLVEKRTYAAAKQKAQAALPNLLLSPRLHKYLYVIAREEKDEKTANVERLFYLRSIEGILATGDGTKERPYLVTRTSDEYDVLWYLKKECKTQALSNADGRYLDMLTCKDGSEIWFDITDAFNTLRARAK